MFGMFHKYDFVILDASYFLLKEADAEVMESLKDSRVYVSVTFEAEWKAYRDLLSEHQRALYDVLARPLPNLKVPSGARSTWEMILDASAKGRSIAVVTGNRLLIERMILEPVKADIFDLNETEWILQEDFSARLEQLEFQKESLSETPPPKEAIGYGTTLYKSDGEEVKLCKLGESRIYGTESQLYGVQNAQGDQIGIAKIFRTGSLTPEKCCHFQRIRQTAQNINAPWAFFPTDTLYRDKAYQIFAGILENYSADSHTLFKKHLYQGDLSSSQELSMTLSDNLRLCWNIVRQICFLNHYGFFVSDFNLKNFAISENDPQHVLMFDTDSFGFQNYFSGFRAAGAKTANTYNTQTKKGALGFCDDALYVFIFSLLSLGSPPIYVNKQQDRVFRFDEKIEDSQRRKLFPEKLWVLFENAFRNRKIFSAEMLLLALTDSLNHLKECPEENFEYGKKLDELAEIELQENSKNTPLAYFAQSFASGKLDRLLLVLNGVLIVIIILYFLFRSSFFGELP